MRSISLFVDMSLDGYIAAPGDDLSGFSSRNEAFSPGGGAEVDTILLGRRTYDMMKSFWPTPQAQAAMPDIARFLNESHKVVASRQPFEPGWKNVTVISGDVVQKVRLLKEQPGKNILIFGSNTLCAGLVQVGLIDVFQIMLNPVLFGDGVSLLKGAPGNTPLVLKSAQAFPSGAVLLTYTPAAG